MAKIKIPTAKIVLRKDRTLKNGVHPVALRVTFNRRSKYYTLKGDYGTISSGKSTWEEELGRIKPSNDDNITINHYEEKAQKALKKFEDGEFSFGKFEKQLFGVYEDINVDKYFSLQIISLKAENRLGTAESYTYTRNNLRRFNNNRAIHFRDLDHNYITRFGRYLKTSGCAVSTTGIYLRTFRALINKAIREGYLDEKDYPFKYFTIKTGQATKRALSKEAMKKLMGYKAKNGTRLARSLDYFVFSYLTRGMNMMDMANLKWKENIIGDRIIYIRAKTMNTKSVQEQHNIEIIRQIEKILKKYPKVSDYVFPILENGLTVSAERYRIKATLKRISKDITAIATELKIPEAAYITFYWSRHTWATVQKRSGEPVSIISEGLGHSSEKTTRAYLDSFDTDRMDATSKNLF